jgi:hypothetical protein
MNAQAVLASVRALGAEIALRDGTPWLLRDERLPAALIDAARAAKATGVPIATHSYASLLQAEAANDQADAIDHAEAEAIAASDYAPPVGRAWTLEDYRRHKRHLDGLQRAADQRPPSWSGFHNTPAPGAWCSCCRGQSWWSARNGSRGWCCARCHPHAAPAGVMLEVSTLHSFATPEADDALQRT